VCNKYENQIQAMKSNNNEEKSATPCTLPRHLLVMFYDGVVIIALLMLATVLAMLAGAGNHTAMQDPVYTAYLLVVWFIYLVWCWHKGGMTLGMRAWHVCITDEAGGRPGWRSCAVRFLTSILSAAVVGLGFIWSLLDREKRTWHDRASGTRLIRY